MNSAAAAGSESGPGGDGSTGYSLMLETQQVIGKKIHNNCWVSKSIGLCP